MRLLQNSGQIVFFDTNSCTDVASIEEAIFTTDHPSTTLSKKTNLTDSELQRQVLVDDQLQEKALMFLI